MGKATPPKPSRPSVSLPGVRASRGDTPDPTLLQMGIDAETKSFHLVGDIDESALARTYVAVMALKDVGDESTPLTVFLTTNGGSVVDGLGIYDLLTNAGCPVTIAVVGYAFSMGSVILQAATTRVLMPNSYIMAHWGIRQQLAYHPDDWKANDEFNSAVAGRADQILYKRIKRKKKSFTLDAFKKKTAADWYLTPAQAVEWGLADRIGGNAK